MAEEKRPHITKITSGFELHRWYWLKSELEEKARVLGISAGGSKIELAKRIGDTLDGKVTDRTEKPRAKGATQLSGNLTLDTVIPPGQRSSQVLRVFFEQKIGSSFHFDKAMREYIANANGQTLGDAIEFWKNSRVHTESKPIDEQFEYNRFTRAWYKEHPNAPRSEVIRAWKVHRAKPKY